MSYALTVLDELYAWRTWLLVIAGVLLLDVLVLALLSRRYRASPFLRLLLVVTLALAVSAGLLAGLTEWQIRTLHIPFPFIRRPDEIQYVTPPVVGVVGHAVVVITVGAALVLLFEGVVLAQRVGGVLASGLRSLK